MKYFSNIFVMLIIIIGFTGCGVKHKDKEQEMYSDYSITELKTDLSQNRVDKINIYYLSYSINFNKPLKKEDFISASQMNRISLDASICSDYHQIADAFNACPFNKLKKGIGDSRLACEFINSTDRKHIMVYFNYDLKYVEIKNDSYQITEEFLYSILNHLPKDAYELTDRFYKQQLQSK